MASTLQASKDTRNVIGGQYGLASKEFTPKHAYAAFENLKAKELVRYNWRKEQRTNAKQDELKAVAEANKKKI